MRLDTALPTPSRSFGWACALVGVDAELMSTCPARDRDSVRLLSILMVLVWLWQSAVFAAVAHLMLAQPGDMRVDLIAGAMLLATIILLIDAYVVMRPSWTGFGYEELRRGGFSINLPILAKVKGGLFLTLRLTLSAVIGTLVALSVSLILYGKDIAGQLTTEYAVRNAPVIAAATRAVDARIADAASGQAALRARLAATEHAADGLRQGLVAPADPATAGLVAELTRAERAREQAEASVARQRQRAGTSGFARAQHRLETATADRDAARARLNDAESRALALVQGRDNVLANQLAGLEAQRRQDMERLTTSEAEQRKLRDGRAAAIRVMVAADLRYVATDDGFLAHLHALKTLTADPWVGAIVLLLEVFFAGIELAAVFSKLLSFVPAAYTTRLAREDQLRQLAAARDLAAAIDGSTPVAAELATRRERRTPAAPTSADSSASVEFDEALPASISTTFDPDRSPSPDADIDVIQSQQAVWADEATRRSESENVSSISPIGDASPKRRRGRPPKAR